MYIHVYQPNQFLSTNWAFDQNNIASSCRCIYITYVKRKVWIQTICGFCCANPGPTLCAANPRTTFQPALSADCACTNLTNEMNAYPTNEMYVWRHKNEYHSFCGISTHLSVWRDEGETESHGTPWGLWEIHPLQLFTHAHESEAGPVSWLLSTPHGLHCMPRFYLATVVQPTDIQGLHKMQHPKVSCDRRWQMKLERRTTLLHCACRFLSGYCSASLQTCKVYIWRLSERRYTLY